MLYYSYLGTWLGDETFMEEKKKLKVLNTFYGTLCRFFCKRSPNGEKGHKSTRSSQTVSSFRCSDGTSHAHKSCKWMSDHFYDSLIRKCNILISRMSCLLLCLRKTDKLQANPQLWLVNMKKIIKMNELKTSKRKKKRDAKWWQWHRHWSRADWEIILVIVNISGIRQYYSTDPDLVRLCRLTKSHQLELLISSTGCCACCSVVAVICVRLLVYQDYAATSTGVGNRQMSERHKQTRCVFIWSVLLLEFPNLDQIASRDKKKKWKLVFSRWCWALKEEEH